MDLKEYPIKFLIIALFIICIFTFGTLLQEKNTSIIGMDTSGIDISGITASLNQTQASTTAQMESFTKENPILAFGELVLFGVWGIIKTSISSTVALVSFLLNGMGNVLGIPPIVLGVLSSIILIGMMILDGDLEEIVYQGTAWSLMG